MSTKEKRDIEAIKNQAKAEIREGVAGRKMTLTEVSMKMTEAIKEMEKCFLTEIEEVINEEHYTGETNCPDCGKALKKTAK